MDYKTKLIEIIEAHLPTLVDKIQPGVVDASTPVPYAAFQVSEKPIRTIHGIAGYTNTLELVVIDSKFSKLDELKKSLIKSLDSIDLGGKRCYFQSAEQLIYNEYELHGFNLNFKIN